MTDRQKTMEEFVGDMVAYIDAGVAYERASTLAYNESARVTGELVNAATTGLPVDVANLLKDCEGCKVLGERAIAAKKAWDLAADRFYGWAEKMGGRRQ